MTITCIRVSLMIQICMNICMPGRHMWCMLEAFPLAPKAVEIHHLVSVTATAHTVLSSDAD